MRFITCCATLLLAASMAGCESSIPTSAGDVAVAEPLFGIGSDFADLTPDIQKDLAALRSYASPLHNLERAMAAGFDIDVTGCRDNQPTGGMGHHYANLSRIDGAAPTVLEPEILVFAPKNSGKLQLAAVEYIVPYVFWPSTDPPPVLFGQEFHPNGNDQLWMLHVWAWWHNPDGSFADWNPTVTCS
jgi:hypothetical protein